MIVQDAFTVEPWNFREPHLDLDLLAQTESVFALANGHVGWRANLDEGEPHGLPGSYLNGVYESRPLPYAERAYGPGRSPVSRRDASRRTAGPPERRPLNPGDDRTRTSASNRPADPKDIPGA